MSQSIVYCDQTGVAWTVTPVARLRSFDADWRGSAPPAVRYLLRFVVDGRERFAFNVPFQWWERRTLARAFDEARVSHAAGAAA
ncbi:MAG: hypothetical protein ACREON_14995 [Gemmatimonadaceae bacterium]